MPGRARGNQVRLRPKTTRPTKSGYGDWSHRRLRCGISRCAARAGLSSRGSSYASRHEGRRVLRSAGPAVFANTNSTFGTIGNRFSFTGARGSREKGACFRLARMYHQPPLRRTCTALVGTEGSNFVAPAVSRQTKGSLAAEAHLPFVPRYRMFESVSLQRRVCELSFLLSRALDGQSL